MDLYNALHFFFRNQQKIRGQSSGSNYGNIGVYGSPTSSNSGKAFNFVLTSAI